MKKNIMIIIVVYLIFAKTTAQANIDLFIEDRENYVKELSKLTLKLFEDRCNSTMKMCKNCTFYGCADDIPNLSCDNHFNVDYCKKCKDKGRILSKKFSTIQFPPKIKILNERYKEIVCALKHLDVKFIENAIKSPNLAWQYFASYNGVMFNYPGIDFCRDFDPRYTPWFINIK